MKTRNYLLDLIKLILSVGVIFVHFPVAGAVGKMLASIGTMGVIVFFLISGYACYNPTVEDNSANILRRMKRIVQLTLISVLVYFAYTMIESLCLKNFTEWIMSFQNPWLYPKILFFGSFDFIHADHLWFLVALTYAYVLMYFVEKKSWGKMIAIALPFLILLRIGLETYTNSFSGDWHWAGNAIVGALPMLALGYYIHRCEAKIYKINGKLWLGTLVISCTLMFVTVNNNVWSLDISQVFKISTATVVFICCLCYKNVMKENVFTRLGKEVSLYIYIYHFLVGVMLREIFIQCGWTGNVMVTWFPWIVVAVGITVSYGIVAVKRRWDRK